MANNDKPNYLNFEIGQYPRKPDIDYRCHPHLYCVGKGERGVLIYEHYKSEIGQFWRFRNENFAIEAAQKFMSCLSHS